MSPDWVRIHADLRPRLEHVANAILSDEHEAEDAVQDAFLRALESAKSARTITSPRGWLVRVTQHVAINRMHARRRRRHIGTLTCDVHDAAVDGIADRRSALPESSPELAEAIAALPRALRRVVRQTLRGRPLRRIAIEEGISFKAAKTRMCRARARVREALS